MDKENLEKQGYRIVGSHSAVKVCHWCKQSLRGEGVCYKEKFYGIKSHRCVQMTPALPFCNHRCRWCWRDIKWTEAEWKGKVDEPEEIVDGCIEEQKKYLIGFLGNEKADKKKLKEMQEPNQFAISLSGEPTMYPKLPGLIKELKKRGITSFLVSNGTNPEMLKRLLKEEPTQLYITLPAPNEDVYKKVCGPLIKDGWKRIMRSLSLLKKFKRNVLRLTLVKGANMVDAEGYKEIIEKYEPGFVECKAYMWVGFSRERLKEENMPSHEEIKAFGEKIAPRGYNLIGEKKDSRVVLLSKSEETKIQ